jgi:hypothetical protein
MSIYSLACPTVGCYQNFICDPEFQNKVVAVAYVKKSAASTINKSTAELWRTSLLTALLDGDAYIVFNTSGEKPKPETGTTSGRGMQNTKALAKTHTLSYMDMQGIVLQNVEWYNQMLAASQNYDFYYFTPGRIWDASGSYITVIGDPVITAELNTYMMADVQVTWVSKLNPLPYEFDTDSFLEGLYFEIKDSSPLGGPPEIVFNVIAAGGTITNPNGAFLNPVGITTPTGLVWGIQAGASALPAGITMPDTTNGNIVVAGSVAAGTYELTVTVTNAAGCVFGTLDITIIKAA